MIQVEGLTKEYEGVAALRGISLTVPTGAIFGFIGPNGAGKTTTLKILGTLLEPSTGSAKVMGVDVAGDPAEVRRLVGWMPDQYGMYGDLKVWEYLDFFAGAYRIPRAKRLGIIDTVLGLVDLQAKREAYVAGLSRGMTQRLCLARALLHEPPVLLLDEPASGLDPQARIELRELLKELQKMGKTILVSSHILPELAEYCSGVAIIQDGAILFAGGMHELAERTGEGRRRIRLKVTSGVEKAREVLAARPEVRRVLPSEDSVLEAEVVADDAALAGILAALVAEKVAVSQFQEVQMDLGDVFMKITRGEAP